MAATAGRREHPSMHRLPLVYTAAYRASGDQAVAEQVAERVMLAASEENATTLAERAVLLALRAAPDRSFAPMRAGLRAVLSAGGGRRTPQPLRGSGSAASPGRA